MRSKLLNIVSFRIPEELLKKLNATCEKRAISRSNLFRNALEKQLEPDGDARDGTNNVHCK